MEGSFRGNLWLRVIELLFKSAFLSYFSIFQSATSSGFARRHVGLLSGICYINLYF